MTKRQKIFLIVFLAMFIVPEVLWSPAGNFVYELSQTSKSGGTHPFRQNFLQDSSNINYLSTVLFIQFLGALITAIYLVVIRKVFAIRILLWTLVAALLLISIVLFFIFGFSITLRHIGF